MASIKEIMDDAHTVAPDTLPGGHAGREEAMSKILQAGSFCQSPPPCLSWSHALLHNGEPSLNHSHSDPVFVFPESNRSRRMRLEASMWPCNQVLSEQRRAATRRK